MKTHLIRLSTHVTKSHVALLDQYAGELGGVTRAEAHRRALDEWAEERKRRREPLGKKP